MRTAKGGTSPRVAKKMSVLIQGPDNHTRRLEFNVYPCLSPISRGAATIEIWNQDAPARVDTPIVGELKFIPHHSFVNVLFLRRGKKVVKVTYARPPKKIKPGTELLAVVGNQTLLLGVVVNPLS